MIKGQADTFFRQLKHRYREVPNFANVYNQAIEIVKDAKLEVTIKNINIVLEDFVERRDIDHEIELHDMIQGIYIVEIDRKEEMYSRGQVVDRWPFLGGLIDKETFRDVGFEVGDLIVRVIPYVE